MKTVLILWWSLLGHPEPILIQMYDIDECRKAATVWKAGGGKRGAHCVWRASVE